MTTSELVFEDTEIESVKLGRDASGEPRVVKFSKDLRGAELRDLDTLLLSRGIDFAPDATWIIARDGGLQHAVERYTPKELTVGDLREKLARVPSGFGLWVMLQSLRVGIFRVYQDTTDEFGNFGKRGTFKLSAAPDGSDVAMVGRLRQALGLADADTRVVLVDGERIQLAAQGVHVVDVKVGANVVTFQTLPRAVKS
jgi:hypothetical protein